jgi:segregation and condensation protein B
MDQTLIQRIVEAALLAANQPLTVVQLQGLFPLDEPAPEGGVARALESLQADCAGRGIELVEVASGWRYQVRAEVHPWVARLWTERQARYTRATLETLALIAYRQPITRGEIEQVRGVAVNSNIIKALEEREWIRVVGHRDVPGRPELLGTTKGFLDYFGLKRLDELPPLSELKDFGELDPEFAFDKPDTDGMPVGDVAPAGPGPVGAASAATRSHPSLVAAEAAPTTTATENHNPGRNSNAADEPNEHALAEDGDSTGARHE